ncbi:MAG: hypothetical protein ABI572_07870 [Actinomycetota bacterium]
MEPDLGRPASREQSLLQIPIVLALDAEAVPLVRAGAARAGDGPTVIVAVDPDLAALLTAVHGVAAEYVIAVCSSPGAAGRVVRAAVPRRGRPLPVLGISGGFVDTATLALLRDPSLEELNVAVPTLEGDGRRQIWDCLRADRIEERHHLVEVDGRPALAELAELAAAPAQADLGTSLEGIGALAAGAAGVLAGRMAATGRRWRAGEQA